MRIDYIRDQDPEDYLLSKKQDKATYLKFNLIGISAEKGCKHIIRKATMASLSAEQFKYDNIKLHLFWIYLFIPQKMFIDN